MGTTSEELKKLYKKLGGKDPKVAGFSAPGEILNAINEIPLPTEYELPTVTTEDTGDVLVVNDEGKWDKGEAGGGLPEVTTDDNGDILQVIEGAWAKAAISENISVYECQVYSANSYSLKYFKNKSDIIKDMADNKLVVVIWKDLSTILRTFIAFNTNGGPYLATWGISNGVVDDHTVIYEFTSNSVFSERSKIGLPKVSSNDNGNVLTVVNGAWGKALPTHTYSTTEQVVGTWINGKPVYEKTITADGLGYNTWNQIATGVDDIDDIISVQGYQNNSTGIFPVQADTYAPDPSFYYVKLQNKFQFYSISSTTKAAITFRYTKTTDTATT